MPVPQSPYTYRRVEPPPKQEDDFENPLKRPPRPTYTTRYKDGKYTVGVEAFLLTEETKPGGRKTSLTGSGAGCHRSRERFRHSAVQRRVERKLAEKEKDREKERDRSRGTTTGRADSCGSKASRIGQQDNPPQFDIPCQSRNSSPGGFRKQRDRSGARDRSGTRSENGFILGAGRSASPYKENIEPGFFEGINFRRSARSCSGTRYRSCDGAEESGVKTYITIEPGKPTRIREHSPAKSAKLSSEETVTSARERSAQSRPSSPLKSFDCNRTSPSPQRKTRDFSPLKNFQRDTSPDKKKDLLRNASPLKSTDLFKTFRASTDESNFANKLPSNEAQKDFSGQKNNCSRTFHSERTFIINEPIDENTPLPCKPIDPGRRLSVDIIKILNPTADDPKRDSPESIRSSTATFSTFSSPLSGSTDSVESDRSTSTSIPIRLSERRISLEQRFKARTSRVPSPERKPEFARSDSRTSDISDISGLHSNQFIYQQTTTTHYRRHSQDNRGSNFHYSSANRKISLPQPVSHPQPAPRKIRSCNRLSLERWAIIQNVL